MAWPGPLPFPEAGIKAQAVQVPLNDGVTQGGCGLRISRRYRSGETSGAGVSEDDGVFQDLFSFAQAKAGRRRALCDRSSGDIAPDQGVRSLGRYCVRKRLLIGLAALGITP
jgi:hypothetical protein